MQLLRAEALCPTARFLPADETAYQATHQTLEAVARAFTDRVETAGLGFLFVDVTGLERRFRDSHKSAGADGHPSTGSGHRLARRLAAEARKTTQLDVRVGLAGNRFTDDIVMQVYRMRGPEGSIGPNKRKIVRHS